MNILTPKKKLNPNLIQPVKKKIHVVVVMTSKEYKLANLDCGSFWDILILNKSVEFEKRRGQL